MMRLATRAAAAIALALLPAAARTQTLEMPSLSLEGARKVIAAARAEAAAKSGAASAQQDDELATAGAVAIGNPGATGTSGTNEAITYLPADKVHAAFEKGMPLVETGAYKVHASRRDRDGQAEVHVRDTDIVYVLEGSATLVTGGQVVNGRVTAEDEQRGEAIAGGDVRHLVKGDVAIVPSGVPHLFKDVKAPLLYYVVKVTAPRRPS